MEIKDYNVKITYFNLGARIIEFRCTQVEKFTKIPGKINLIPNNITGPGNLKAKLRELIETQDNFTVRVYNPNLSYPLYMKPIIQGTDRKKIYLQLDSRGQIVSLNMELGVLNYSKPEKIKKEVPMAPKARRPYKKKSSWWDKQAIPLIPDVGATAVEMTKASNKLAEADKLDKEEVSEPLKANPLEDLVPILNERALNAITIGSHAASHAVDAMRLALSKEVERKGAALALFNRMGEQLLQAMGNDKFLYALQHIMSPKGIARKFPYIVWADLEKLIDEVEEQNQTKDNGKSNQNGNP